jgi:hypothetical protein
MAQTEVAEPLSNGQTEGQINRLKTLKRAGSASLSVLPALISCLVADIDAHEGEMSLVSWASRADFGHRMRLR